MKKLITLIGRIFGNAEKNARKIEEFRTTVTAFTSLEEACGRYPYAEKCGPEVAEIFKNRIDELMIARIAESKTTDDLEELRKIYPFRETERSPLIAKLFIERWTDLSVTSEHAREAFRLATKWSPWLNLDESIQERANQKLDELVLIESSSATTASAARDIFLRARKDTEAWNKAAQRWISLCSTLEEAEDLTNHLYLLGELSNTAYLHRLAMVYRKVQNLSDPYDASCMLDALEEDSPIKKIVIDRWDEISLDLAKKAENKDQIVEAFESSRDGSEAEMIAVQKMAKLLHPDAT